MYAITIRKGAKVRDEQTKAWARVPSALVANATLVGGCLYHFSYAGRTYSAGWQHGDVWVDAR